MIGSTWRAITPAVPALWLGVLMGVSFLATPVKFRSELLERAVALDVGRVTFETFHMVEWSALILTGLVAWFVRRRWAWAVTILLTLILLAQGMWLLPELSARAALVAQGLSLPASHVHVIYVLLEGVKAIMLAGLMMLFAVHVRPGHD